MSGIPGGLLRVGGNELLLADSAESTHKDDYGVPIEAAAAHIHLFNAIPARALCPVRLYTQACNQALLDLSRCQKNSHQLKIHRICGLCSGSLLHSQLPSDCRYATSLAHVFRIALYCMGSGCQSKRPIGSPEQPPVQSAAACWALWKAHPLRWTWLTLQHLLLAQLQVLH